MMLIGSNVRRIGAVDHLRRGVFLFNYFFADELSQTLGVWDYTAGWFQDQTGLDNSIVILPDPDQQCPYKILNHCRWDYLVDFCRPYFLNVALLSLF